MPKTNNFFYPKVCSELWRITSNSCYKTSFPKLLYCHWLCTMAISQAISLFLQREKLTVWFNFSFLEQLKCKNCIHMKVGNGSDILYCDLEFVSKCTIKRQSSLLKETEIGAVAMKWNNEGNNTKINNQENINNQ